MHTPVAAVPGRAHLVPSVAPLAHTNEIRASSSAQRTVSVPVTTRRVCADPGSPFAPGDPGGPGGPCAPALRPLCAGWTRWTLWTLCAARTRWALRTLFAARTRRALWTLCARRTRRTLRTLCAARTRWALRTRGGLAASRYSERHEEDRNAHQSHRPSLRHRREAPSRL
jgi:hypothetical protein